MTHLRPVLSLLVLATLLFGVAFPVAFSGLGALILPFQSGGSLIQRDGKLVGSALIGQNFTADKYLHGRISALTGTDPKDATKQVPTPYDASESGGSNLGPTSQALMDRVKADVANAGPKPVPADAVTSSGSGLDPDISPDNADRQVARIAKARNLSADQVRGVVAANTAGPFLGLFGAAHVNVLAVNLALDTLKAS